MGFNSSKILHGKNGTWEVFEDEKIGEGGFSTVYKGKDKKTGETVAIKFIAKEIFESNSPKNSHSSRQNRKEHIKKSIHREINLLQQISSEMKNPFLLKIKDHCQIKEEGEYLILEYCDSGDLKEIMEKTKQKTKSGTIHEDRALKIAYQILIGLKALDGKKIIHRDLKPSNIFKHNGIYKIGDFGFANKTSQFLSLLGTEGYMAPEFYDLNEEKLNNAVDIWAFGCIFHQMVFGILPFKGVDLMQQVLFKEYRISGAKKLRSDTKDMMRRCMEKNPGRRIKIKELLLHKCFDSCRKEVQEQSGIDLNLLNDNDDSEDETVEERDIILNLNIALEEISDYRITYKFYFETSKKMDQEKSLSRFHTLMLAKRALDRAKILEKNLENNTLLQECPLQIRFQKKYWEFILLSDEIKTCQKRNKNDIQKFQNNFDDLLQKYQQSGKVTTDQGFDLEDKEYVHKNIINSCNSTLRKIYESRFGGNKNMKKLQIGVRLAVIISIEKNSFREPYYHKMEKFMEEMEKKSDEQLMSLLKEFC